jgi:MoaA/NifB/PqqE/SkfB family radical SAM enzyme
MLTANYIGVFLTFKCRMGCGYCINRAGTLAPRTEISVDEWMKILGPLQTREDLPISLQGGEPTEYPGFYELATRLHEAGKRVDVLTNGEFDVNEFIRNTVPQMFQRSAPYASIRFSFHAKTDEVLLVWKVMKLASLGYSVGIWGLDHPSMTDRNKRLAGWCKEMDIDFRMKEYLDETHGTYKYPDAVTGKKEIAVHCFPSEILFAPDGKIHPCHHFLYSGDMGSENLVSCLRCGDYGLCNPCDVKLKTNRLQEAGHCSVRIEKLMFDGRITNPGGNKPRQGGSGARIANHFNAGDGIWENTL